MQHRQAKLLHSHSASRNMQDSKPSETVSALLSGTASSDQVNLPARSPVVRAARGLSSSASDWLMLSSPATSGEPLMTKNASSVLLLHHCCGCCCGSLALSRPHLGASRWNTFLRVLEHLLAGCRARRLDTAGLRQYAYRLSMALVVLCSAP